MEITGYQIRESLNRFELQSKLVEQQVQNSIFAFDDEDQQKPQELIGRYSSAQESICRLQVLRSIFNNRVTVVVAGKKMSLALAVKLVGAADRAAKLWKTAATSTGDDNRWSANNRLQRSKESVYAKRQISVEEAAKRADEANRWATSLRSAIAEGNAQKMAIVESTPNSSDTPGKLAAYITFEISDLFE